MLVRIYWWMCSLVTLAALVVFAAAGFTMFAGVVFGFLAFGLTFIGMIAVLPSTVGHNAHVSPATVEIKTIEAVREPAVKGFGILKSA